jgi:hypothetical protein
LMVFSGLLKHLNEGMPDELFGLKTPNINDL